MKEISCDHVIHNEKKPFNRDLAHYWVRLTPKSYNSGTNQLLSSAQLSQKYPKLAQIGSKSDKPGSFLRSVFSTL